MIMVNFCSSNFPLWLILLFLIVKYLGKYGFCFKKCCKLNTITIFLLAYIFRGVRDWDRKPIGLLYRGVTHTTSVANPWHFVVDPDLDPRIHASDEWIRIRIGIWMRIRIPLFSSLTFKMLTKNKKNFRDITFWRCFYIFFQRWKVKKKSQNRRNQG